LDKEKENDLGIWYEVFIEKNLVGIQVTFYKNPDLFRKMQDHKEIKKYIVLSKIKANSVRNIYQGLRWFPLWSNNYSDIEKGKTKLEDLQINDRFYEFLDFTNSFEQFVKDLV
jgi:hypothetical protein